jgi:DNA-binding GntR family transcriptional regulator
MPRHTPTTIAHWAMAGSPLRHTRLSDRALLDSILLLVKLSPPCHVTSEELIELLGCSPSSVSDRLRRMRRAGLLDSEAARNLPQRHGWMIHRIGPA